MCTKIIKLYLTAEGGNDNGSPNHIHDNTDVLVILEEEDDFGLMRTAKYVATFFSYRNIQENISKHHKSGDYLYGRYFFFKNMVLIDECTKKNIEEVVNNLIMEGDFKDAFKRL